MPNSVLFDWKEEQLAALCRASGARRLDAFGSVVRQDFDADSSDLDFLVEFDDIAPSAYAAAYFELKSGLERLFARKVDLVTSASLVNPFFIERLASERKTVYAR
jgi:predicted nucleotidyltransferase